MKIKKTIQKEEIIDIDLETPAYFKTSDRYYVAIYSDALTIKVTSGSNGFAIIQKCEYRNMYKPEEILTDGEPITAEEFNEVLRDALHMIEMSALPEPLHLAV